MGLVADGTLPQLISVLNPQADSLVDSLIIRGEIARGRADLRAQKMLLCRYSPATLLTSSLFPAVSSCVAGITTMLTLLASLAQNRAARMEGADSA